MSSNYFGQVGLAVYDIQKELSRHLIPLGKIYGCPTNFDVKGWKTPGGEVLLSVKISPEISAIFKGRIAGTPSTIRKVILPILKDLKPPKKNL